MEDVISNNLIKIKDKISRGELVIGTSVQLADPVISEMLGGCGFDFIWIEGEHSTLDKRGIDMHIMAVSKSGIAPFVRVAWNDPVIVKPVLDMGPAAIIFPFIKTPEEAKLAVSSCKYPPKGIRGFGPIRANEYSMMDNEKYLKLSEKEPWIILQVEHVDAVNNLEKILKVEGIDSILVGPNDLSGSIGLLGQTRHPEVIKLLDRIAVECNKAKIPFGVSTGFNEKNITDWINRGISWIAVDGDSDYLVSGAINCLKNTSKLFQEIKK
jgi:2-keto-3-deoxy-L-rhamnonate aldolase RhmA